MYIVVKHLHVTLALLSLGLFCLRACWSMTGSRLLQNRWVRIVPHVIDTFLLVCGLWLAFLLSAWSFPWLQAKLVAIVVYIMLGAMVIRPGRSARVKAVMALLAIAVFGYILAVAISKNPLPFPSWLFLSG